VLVVQRFIISILLIIGLPVFAQNILITDIEKEASNRWNVTYVSKVPINSIQFVITKDNSRHARWSIISEGFELRTFNGKDTLFRRDGQSFKEVVISLTPTYTSLPKYYAPFSPYSEGSMLFHSARFFACPSMCSGFENLWYIRVTAPPDETILVNGLKVKRQASWYDSGDGTKVFIGKLLPIERDEVITVIDPALPNYVISSLETFLPAAFRELSTQLTTLESRPMLFASFGKMKEGSYGRQGGVLPNQIFMHWYGTLPKSDIYDLLWFYAHEATHIFQRLERTKIEEKNAWIHEGHAEYVASNLLRKFDEGSVAYVNLRIEKARTNCVANAMESNPVTNKEYKQLYECGLYFYSLIAHYSSQAEQSAYMFWKVLAEHTKKGGEVNKSAVLNIVENLFGKKVYQQVLEEMKWQKY